MIWAATILAVGFALGCYIIATAVLAAVQELVMLKDDLGALKREMPGLVDLCVNMALTTVRPFADEMLTKAAAKGTESLLKYRNRAA